MATSIFSADMNFCRISTLLIMLKYFTANGLALKITSSPVINVSENHHSTTFRVATIETDAPKDRTLIFQIDDSTPANQNYFTIESASGGLILTKPFNYEETKNLTLFISVHDKAADQEARQKLLVNVVDVDEPPHFTQKLYESHINLTSEGQPGLYLLTVKAIDPENGQLNYSYPCDGKTDFGNITVDISSGNITVAPNHILKAETHNYTFCVQVNDTSQQRLWTTMVQLYIYHMPDILKKTTKEENNDVILVVLIVVFSLVGLILTFFIMLRHRQIKHCFHKDVSIAQNGMEGEELNPQNANRPSQDEETHT